ncbi:HlyD family efflux transporter periplasmic adaptor subunit [Demequina sp. NBRC 110057]|uniref:HlyD family secretion protein n=1 Tax=Demequina sp. NBRC 110057 TaxID=1570346 RepID=UPI0009FC1F88|nr:HlyD family efflux transporter periplasmic adaptor subunit [Demequina sp. NBRC 110057]
MTWANRLRLTLGLIFVVALVAALTYIYTAREASATSETATFTAADLPIGTDYGGRVVDTMVEAGDQVAEGDPLVTLESHDREDELQQEADAAEDAADRAAEAAEADDATAADRDEAESLAEEAADAADRVDDTWTVTASAAGTVAEVPVGQGGYIPTGGTAATVYEDGSLAIEAELVLSPRDYDRLEQDAEVTVELPDSSEMTGSVESVEATTEDGAARAKVAVASAALKSSEPTGLTAPGTPLVTTVALRDDGPLAGLRDAAVDFLARMGLS